MMGRVGGSSYQDPCGTLSKCALTSTAGGARTVEEEEVILATTFITSKSKRMHRKIKLIQWSNLSLLICCICISS